MRAIAILLSASLLGACATTPAPPESQLAIRAAQTRSYQTKDTKMVMKAVLDVLQDEAFIIKAANVELGILTATRDKDVSPSIGAKFVSVLVNPDAAWDQTTTVECSANISAHGDETRVRVNFQTKVVDSKGGVTKITTIEDEAYYAEFFAKVDKGIFIEKQKL